MAYALGFPRDVTDRIYSMRDWRWEIVRRNGGTPSRLCFKITSWHEDGKPWLLALYMPYYTVESDSERPDYGEVVLDHWNRDEPRKVQIERSDGTTFLKFTLREYRGDVPAKFRQLQKQNDRRVRETWFQCERAAP